MYIFEWEGDPIPQARPRLGKYGAYNPQANEKIAARWILKNQYRQDVSKQPISINVIYYIKIPQKTNKNQKAEMAQGLIFPTKKPDIDNLLKFTLDVMQGIVFDDDNQVVRVTASKCYAEKPRTRVVMEIENEEN